MAGLYGKGSNVTVSIMIDQLYNMRATLPEWGVGTCYVQLDNTTGDNKNSYVFGNLANLVMLGMFKEVLSNIHHFQIHHNPYGAHPIIIIIQLGNQKHF